MFEVHGWLELLGNRAEDQALDENLRRMGEPPSEWCNGLLLPFWSNGHRFVHLARLWNHRDVGEAAIAELCATLGTAARGKIDVFDHDEMRSEVWWLESGELTRQPVEDPRYQRWFA